MSRYRAVDTEALDEQLGRIADAVDTDDLPDETVEEMGDAMSEINRLMHSMEKPIEIEDHSGAFEVSISKQ